ncbi:hypothetical protein ACL9RJ_12015 [Pseudomonas sp. Mn2068]|uniref:Tse2 family ADP-ribosyltransferase toxin n=1 Tax=Pseudomonas sp. Mn2068 TaxID=3395265 RepID=UPI003BD39292
MSESKLDRTILVPKDQVDRFFFGEIPTNLWRALRSDSPLPLLAPVEKGYMMDNRQYRRPDITVETVENKEWVIIHPTKPEGTSTFDRSQTFKGKRWDYYRLPEGTKIPDGLVIVKDGYNESFEATHYTIAPVRSMLLSTYKRLLADLAQSAIKEGNL